MMTLLLSAQTTTQTCNEGSTPQRKCDLSRLLKQKETSNSYLLIVSHLYTSLYSTAITLGQITTVCLLNCFSSPQTGLPASSSGPHCSVGGKKYTHISMIYKILLDLTPSDTSHTTGLSSLCPLPSWIPCRSSDMPYFLWSSGICVCCSLCLEFPSSYSSAGQLILTDSLIWNVPS